MYATMRGTLSLLTGLWGCLIQLLTLVPTFLGPPTFGRSSLEAGEEVDSILSSLFYPAVLGVGTLSAVLLVVSACLGLTKNQDAQAWAARQRPAMVAYVLLFALAVATVMADGNFSFHLPADSTLGMWLFIASNCTMAAILVIGMRAAHRTTKGNDQSSDWWTLHQELRPPARGQRRARPTSL